MKLIVGDGRNNWETDISTGEGMKNVEVLLLFWSSLRSSCILKDVVEAIWWQGSERSS